MYRWYQGAVVCFAYLQDVKDVSEFGESLWFTRGWTLQELLAPHDLIFYGSEWNRIGRRVDLITELNRVTRIPHNALLEFNPDDFSVADRMSWAAGRQTRRVEDRAYSLLGIFGISMPMLYGEGMRAFQRLQEEIIKYHDDMSLLLWNNHFSHEVGLLANSPSNFEPADYAPNFDAFMLTNAGLRIEVYVTQYASNTRVIFLYDPTELVETVFKDPMLWQSELGRNVSVIFVEHMLYQRYKRVRVNNLSWCKVKELDWKGFPEAFPIDFWPPALHTLTILRSKAHSRPETPLQYCMCTKLKDVDVYLPKRVFSEEKVPSRTNPYKFVRHLTRIDPVNHDSEVAAEDSIESVDCGITSCVRIGEHTDVILSCDHGFRPLIIIQSRDQPHEEGTLLFDEPVNNVLDRFEDLANDKDDDEAVRLSSTEPHYELYRGEFRIEGKGQTMCSINTAHIKLELQATATGYVVTLGEAEAAEEISSPVEEDQAIEKGSEGAEASTRVPASEDGTEKVLDKILPLRKAPTWGTKRTETW